MTTPETHRHYAGLHEQFIIGNDPFLERPHFSVIGSPKYVVCWGYYGGGEAECADWAQAQCCYGHLLILGRSNVHVVNRDRMDGDCVDGELVTYDGLSDKQRDCLERIRCAVAGFE